MSYIIMGRDECGDEFRVTSSNYISHNAATNDLLKAREEYPEARAIWVEELHDKAYFAEIAASRYDNDTYDLY